MAWDREEGAFVYQTLDQRLCMKPGRKYQYEGIVRLEDGDLSTLNGVNHRTQQIKVFVIDKIVANTLISISPPREDKGKFMEYNVRMEVQEFLPHNGPSSEKITLVNRFFLIELR